MTRLSTPRSMAVGCVLAGLLAAPLAQAYEQEIKKQADTLAAGLERAGRKRVAVVDFVDLEGNITQLGRFLAEELSVTLSSLPAGLEVVDRNHLAALLKEKKLSAEGLVDPSTTRRLGQILGVDVLITGSLTSFGESVRVTAKALDADTAKMIAASRIDIAKVETIRTLLASEMPSSEGGPRPPQPTPQKSGGTAGHAPKVQVTLPSFDDLPKVVEQDKFVFDLKGCELAGRTASCVLMVSNKSPQRRTFRIKKGSHLFDDNGNLYEASGASIANVEVSFANDWYVQLPLHSRVPVRTSVDFNDIAPEATRASALELTYSDDNGRESTVTFRDVSFVAKSLAPSNLLSEAADQMTGGEAGGTTLDQGLKGVAASAAKKLFGKLGGKLFGGGSKQ